MKFMQGFFLLLKKIYICADQVERFEVIATTQKNAKTARGSFYLQFFPIIYSLNFM